MTRSHCNRKMLFAVNGQKRARTHLLQNERKTQSSLGSAGAGAGLAELARAEANDSVHIDGRGEMGLETVQHGSSSAIESNAKRVRKAFGHNKSLQRCERDSLRMLKRSPREPTGIATLLHARLILTQLILPPHQQRILQHTPTRPTLSSPTTSHARSQRRRCALADDDMGPTIFFKFECQEYDRLCVVFAVKIVVSILVSILLRPKPKRRKGF
jgi:hypothetical protein